MIDLKHICAQDRAEILVQTLPQIRRFHGKTIVVKYGGNAMTEPDLQQAFAQDIVLLQHLGMQPVVVHGGGPQIDLALAQLGKKTEFIEGMRVTDAQTMQAVQWVLAGQVQQDIVGRINLAGGKAVGLSGRDGAMISAQKLKLRSRNNPALEYDLGQVGDIVHIHTDLLETLKKNGFIPVVSPIGFDADNKSYNINADVVAAQLAIKLKAEKLLLLTNISGVLDQSGTLLTELSAQQVDELLANGSISGGMLPKIAGALNASKSGVGAVHILDGRVAHILLLVTLDNQTLGTLIRA